MLRIQASFDRARNDGAIFNEHWRAVAPIYSKLQRRARFAPAGTKLHEIIAQPVKFACYNTFQRFVHVTSQALKNKKCGATFPHIRPRHNCGEATDM